MLLRRTTSFAARRASGRLRAVVAVLFLALMSPVTAPADDWPQFRGPRRDGLSAETGLATAWPPGGPPIVWRVPLGGGFSAISVADGRLFTLFTRDGEELLGAFGVASGDEIWSRRLDSAYRNSFGSGPRSTPTVDGSIVYALGAKGVLLAADAATGQRIWNRDLEKDFGARIPEWGVATSPLVDGDKLLLDVGGRSNHSLVALDKRSGELIWNSNTGLPGYSSPIVIEVGGRRMAVFMTGDSVIGVDVEDGRKLWWVQWKTRYDVNAATPIFVAPDKIYVSSGYGVGAALLRLRPNGDAFDLYEVWKSRRMKNQFSTAVVVDGTLYGFDNTILKSVRLEDGEENWAARGFGHGSLFYADGHLVVLGERGKLALVAATPDVFEEVASTELFQAKAWTVPTLSDGRLYARNEREMLAVDLAAADRD